MEDNLTSADPLSYTTNRSGVDLVSQGKRLLRAQPNPIMWDPGPKTWKEKLDIGQCIVSLSRSVENKEG